MVYTFGPFELDEDRFELTRSGEVVPLERKVLLTLRCLLRERHRVVARDELLREVWPDVSVSDSSLQRAISRLHRVLGDEPGAAGGPMLKTVYGQGYRFVADVRVRTDAETPVEGLVHQLRAPVADFTGRQDELALLEERIGRGGVTISGFYGLGGIGKTELALQLGHRLRAQFPDAQILLDLRGTDPDPVSARDAMLHVIQSFHPDIQQPDSDARVAGLYRAVLDGKRVLLVLDNARDERQVLPLLPPPGSTLVVTSRKRFVLPGMEIMTLDTLPRPMSRELLLRIAPRIGEHAEAIAARCGDLPLALRLAGSALGRSGHLDPAEFAARLARRSDRLDRFEEVRASIELSFEQLERRLAERLCQLTVLGAGFDRRAAAAVWGEADASQALDDLDHLLSYSLIEWSERDGAGRYSLHDLVRLFAGERLRDPEPARARHARHFLASLREIGATYLEGAEHVQKALAAFDLEADDIAAGFRWSADRARDSEDAARICVAYPNAAFDVIALRLSAVERIFWYRSQLASARSLGDRRLESAALGFLGNAYRELDEPRTALELYQERLALSRERGDIGSETASLGQIGIAYFACGEPHLAIEHYDQCLALAQKIAATGARSYASEELVAAYTRETGDRRGAWIGIDNLGSAYLALGEPLRAIKLYESWLALARDFGDRRGEQVALTKVGNTFRSLGEPERARPYYESWLEIARELGDRLGEGYALSYLSGLHLDLGEPETAIRLAEAHRAIAVEIRDRRGEWLAMGSLGNAYAALGEHHRATGLFEQWLRFTRETGDRLGECSALHRLADAQLALGARTRAIELYTAWRGLAREIGDRGAETEACWRLGLALETDGRLPEAVDLLAVRVAYEREVGHSHAKAHAEYVAGLRERIARRG
ncbi:MAG: winged helix-turn-helix domain-containing protein [Proteobacteria bacterium]|nr:winged helix-turn-helix domain-containing protein [Pseudomonadota bacterium]